MKITPLGHGVVAVEPDDGAEPYVAHGLEGFRLWLKQRAKDHRKAEQACKTSDGANECADRALECEEILRAIGEHWLGPEGK